MAEREKAQKWWVEKKNGIEYFDYLDNFIETVKDDWAHLLQLCLKLQFLLLKEISHAELKKWRTVKT